MARERRLIITDDLDGSDDARPVPFQFEGRDYEIDLSSTNAAKLRRVLKPYVEAGTRVRRQSRHAVRPVLGRGRARNDPEQNRAIRDWAKRTGLRVSDHGRIPDKTRLAYERAMGAGKAR